MAAAASSSPPSFFLLFAGARSREFRRDVCFPAGGFRCSPLTRAGPLPSRGPAAAAPRRPLPPSKQRHWNEGEFPGVSETSLPRPPRSRGHAAAAPPRRTPPPSKKRHWKEDEFPGVSETSLPRPPRSRGPAAAPRRTPPSSKKRHWKEDEFPGVSETSLPRPPRPRAPAAAAPPRPPPPSKKRHWKEGEFPGVSETSLPRPPRSPIKNIKKKIDDRGAAKAWVPTVTEILAEKIDMKQWEAALEVFEMLKKQPFYHPKEGTYMKLLVLLGRCGQPNRALQLFETMVEEELEPTLQLYTALLGAYCRNDLLDDAFGVLAQMKTFPLCQPDVQTYSILIKACVDATRFDLVETLFGEMSERGIATNTVTQNTILSGYGKAGKFDKMEEVLSSMVDNDACKPDVWTMNTILRLFGNEGQIEMMEKWYEKFQSIGIKPDTRTFNILIGAYGKRRMYDKMTAVLEFMRKLQHPWTTSTYNNVIEAFADAGDAKHMEYAFEQMGGEGIKADTKTFCSLIKGYSSAKMFHKVVSSVQMAEKFEIPANTAFYNAVISACAKAEDLMEMERVFKRMKERGVMPDSETISIMVEAYGKEGMHDRIYVLEQEREKMASGVLVGD